MRSSTTASASRPNWAELSTYGGLRFVRSEPIDTPTFFDLENLHFVDADDTEHVRSVVRHPGAVVVVPIDGDQVVLIRQYRAAIGQDVLELPAGKLDVEGEATDVAAARECEEEIGYRPARTDRLISFYNSPGMTDEHTTVFVADGLTYVGRTPIGPEEETSEVVRVAIDEVDGLIQSGEIDDAKSIIGLHAYLRYRHDTADAAQSHQDG